MEQKSVTRLEPPGEFLPLRAVVDRLLEESIIPPLRWLGDLQPRSSEMALDVYEEGDKLIVKAALPGLKPDEVNIHVRGDVLTITAARTEERPSRRRNYRLQEHVYGRLQRSLALSAPVDADKAEAVFADGILTVTLPKTGETETKQIAVKNASPAPADASTVPVNAGPAPAGDTRKATADAGQAQLTASDAAANTGDILMNAGPAPANTGEVPVESDPAPANTGEVPVDASDAAAA